MRHLLRQIYAVHGTHHAASYNGPLKALAPRPPAGGARNRRPAQRGRFRWLRPPLPVSGECTACDASLSDVQEDRESLRGPVHDLVEVPLLCLLRQAANAAVSEVVLDRPARGLAPAAPVTDRDPEADLSRRWVFALELHVPHAAGVLERRTAPGFHRGRVDDDPVLSRVGCRDFERRRYDGLVIDLQLPGIHGVGNTDHPVAPHTLADRLRLRRRAVAGDRRTAGNRRRCCDCRRHLPL
mmetsp:Transcript_2042/g.5106  ORF Transcript_2042/g.5106 Transcript_2042/m.5106 type:complete len:240 (-) Transcript_2042:920-1639(-)